MSQYSSNYLCQTTSGRPLCSFSYQRFTAVMRIGMDCASLPIHAGVIRWAPIRLKAILRLYRGGLEGFQLHHLRLALESLTVG